MMMNNDPCSWKAMRVTAIVIMGILTFLCGCREASLSSADVANGTESPIEATWGLVTSEEEFDPALESDTIILPLNRDLWLVDPLTLEREFLLGFDEETGYDIDGVVATDDREYLFGVIGSRDGGLVRLGEASYVVRIHVATREVEVLFERPNILGVASLSPDEQRAIIAYLPSNEPRTATAFCILHINTGDCEEMNFSFARRQMYWLDETSFLTISEDLLSVINIDTLERTVIEEPEEYSIQRIVPIPGTSDFLANGLFSRSLHEPRLLSLSADTFEVTELPYQVGNIYSISVFSPDGRYLFLHHYEYQPSLAIDFQTGEIFSEIDNIACVGWLSDSRHLILVRVSEEGNFSDMVRYDALEGEIEQSAPIDGSVGRVLIVP